MTCSLASFPHFLSVSYSTCVIVGCLQLCSVFFLHAFTRLWNCLCKVKQLSEINFCIIVLSKCYPGDGPKSGDKRNPADSEQRGSAYNDMQQHLMVSSAKSLSWLSQKRKDFLYSVTVLQALQENSRILPIVSTFLA
jgi:hypothetical protein